MPRNIVAATCNLHRADRRPGAKFSDRHHRAAVVQLRSGATSGRIEEVVVANLRQRRRPVRLDDHFWNADGAIAVEVLVESGLQGLQRGAVARDQADQVRQVVAVAVGAPRGIQAGAGVMPRNIVAATCNLHRADRRPGAKFSDRHHRAAVVQLRSGATSGRIEEVVVANLRQRRRPVRLDDLRWTCHREAGPVAPQRPIVDADFHRVGRRSGDALVGQLRKLGRRYIDLLIVRLNNSVENKVAGARIHEPVRGDRISVRISGRKQR